jgi:tetraacyldisaccharide 4'-kinase
MARLRRAEVLPCGTEAIVPFAVTLEFDDAGRLRKFISARLFQARDRNLRTRN